MKVGEIILRLISCIMALVMALAFQYGGPGGLSPTYPDSFMSYFLFFIAILFFVWFLLDILQYYRKKKRW